MAATSAHGLALIDQASRLLAEAATLHDLKQVRDVSEAARTYAKAAKLGLDLQNQAAELKLRAERKAGAALAKLRLRGGDRRSGSRDVALKLDDLGLSKAQSARWQRCAAVSETEFERFLEGSRRLGKEITAAGLMRIARSPKVRPDSGHEGRPGTDGRRATLSGRAELLALIDEAQNQSELLSSLLEPICQRGDCAAVPLADRRCVSRLLREIRGSLVELKRHLWRPDGMICETADELSGKVSFSRSARGVET